MRAEFAKQARMEQEEDSIVRYLIDVVKDGPIEKKVIALEIMHNMMHDGAFGALRGGVSSSSSSFVALVAVSASASARVHLVCAACANA